MLRIILLALAIAVVGVLGFAATRADTFRVERQARIAARPEQVFPFINDLKAFNRWNPWLRKEPTSKLTYGPVTEGPGAHYAWEGDKTGAGSMTQTGSTAPSRVAFQLDFVKPFEGHNTAEFTLAPDGADGTTVTWTMKGPMPYLSKVMDVLFGMDRMIGPDFEAGLANLKALAEAR